MMTFHKGTTIKIILLFALVCMLMVSSYIIVEYKRNQKTFVTISEPVDKTITEQLVPLKMYVIGEEPEDFQLILEEVNNQLNTAIGVELTVDFISEKDIGVDYHTIFAGGADFDLIEIYPSYYNIFASKYAYMNLTEDMLRKCSPQVNMSELNVLKINNMAYAIPSKAHFENSITMLIRGDLAKTYGVHEIKNIDQLETYMRLIKNNEENIMPLDIGLNGVKLMQFICTQPNGIRLYDNYWIGIQNTGVKENVIWLPETQYFKDYLNKIEEWHKLHYIPQEASGKRIVLSESFLNGNSAIAIGTVFEMENLKRLVEYVHPEYEPQIVTLGNRKLQGYAEPIHHAIAIKNGSQYAAKSLMLIEVLRTNEKVFRLLNYGIEGIHFCITEGGYYRPLADSVRYPIFNNPVWCMTDQFRLKYDFESNIIVPYDQIIEPSIKMYAYGMNSDSFDLTELDAIQRNIGYPLTLGEFGERNSALEAYIRQMEDEGFKNYYKTAKQTIEAQNQ